MAKQDNDQESHDTYLRLGTRGINALDRLTRVLHAAIGDAEKERRVLERIVRLCARDIVDTAVAMRVSGRFSAEQIVEEIAGMLNRHPSHVHWSKTSNG